MANERAPTDVEALCRASFEELAHATAKPFEDLADAQLAVLAEERHRVGRRPHQHAPLRGIEQPHHPPPGAEVLRGFILQLGPPLRVVAHLDREIRRPLQPTVDTAPSGPPRRAHQPHVRPPQRVRVMRKPVSGSPTARLHPGLSRKYVPKSKHTRATISPCRQVFRVTGSNLPSTSSPGSQSGSSRAARSNVSGSLCSGSAMVEV